jgi:hypothetical protein
MASYTSASALSNKHDGSRRPRSLHADLFMTVSSGAPERSTPVTVRMTVNFDHFTNNPSKFYLRTRKQYSGPETAIIFTTSELLYPSFGLVYWRFLRLLEISPRHVPLSYYQVGLVTFERRSE